MNEIFAIVFPGQMLMWLFFITQQPISDISAEASRRTLSRLLSTPATVREFLISKLLRGYIIGMIACYLLILLTWVVFRVNWGNPFTLFLVMTCNSIAVTGVITFIYALAKTMERANALVPAIVVPMAMMGGGMVPLEQMPPFMRSAAVFTVNYWGTVGVQSNMHGKSQEALFPCLVLAAVGFVLLSIGYRIFERRFSAGDLQ